MADKAEKEHKEESEAGSGAESDYVPEKRREQLPDAVDHFLGLLLTALKTRNVPDLHRLYENTFNQLTEKHYKNTKWPSVEAVAEQVSAEPLFIIFYKELYYRHIYSRLQVQFEDRKGSWENYCRLMDLICDDLSQQEDLSVALPGQWTWDLLDEFVYHYQTYCNFRNKAVKIQKEKDITQIKENADVFKTTTVLTYLHKVIKASQIEEYLKNPENPDGKQGGAFTDEHVRLFGYCALMQLLRMHSLLGDYYLAMRTITCIDFHAEVPLFYSIPACHVTLYYYMGFAYMMQRRYVDAIKTFSDILVFLSKTSGVNSLSYQYGQIVKKQDQMYALLLICLTLCPQPVDEAIEKKINETHAEKQSRLQRGEELCFEELFSYACPKFVSGALPDLDSGDNFNANEAHQRQLKLFLQEVREQHFLPRISSYMKLYTAIKTSKLSQLCEMDEEGLRDQLMCVMHKTHQRVRRDGAPLDGEIKPCSEVEFYLDGDMVHINATRIERPHSDVFIEQILKYQDILRKMDKSDKN
jgi:translation initiation factor 3 subunit L